MPATVVIENVPGFLTSQAGTILQLQLRRMGYHLNHLTGEYRFEVTD